MAANSQLYTADKVPNAPIIYMTLYEGYDMIRDLPYSTATAIELMNQQSTQVFYIVDLRALDLDLDALVDGTNGASGDDNSVYRHPRVREVLFISNQEVVELAAQGLNSAVFGYVKASVFATPDEAFDHVRRAE